MRILTRYILKECLLYVGLCLVAFTGLLLTIQLLKFADLIINRGVALSQIALVFSAIIPTFLEFAVPMATVLGVMLAIARLAGDSEIVVLRASGISFATLIRPVAALGIVLASAGFVVSLYLKPWGYSTLAEALFDIARSRSTAGLEVGVFNKLGSLTLYPEKLDYNTGELKNVVVDDRRGQDATSQRIFFAQTGRIVSDSTARTITLLLRDGEIHEEHEGKYSLTRFTTNAVTIDPQELTSADNDKEPAPRSLYLGQLGTEMQRYRKLTQISGATELGTPLVGRTREIILARKPSDIVRRLRRLALERGLRFSMPFAALLLALVALPLGVQPPRAQRSWGPSVSLAIGLGVFVCYYGILSIGITLVERGAVSALLACWLPNLAVAASAAWFCQLLMHEKIQSIADILTPRLAWVTHLIRERRATA